MNNAMLVIIMALSLSTTKCSCKFIYITPEEGHSCPNGTQQCYTLLHVATNPNNYFRSNTRVVFLPGEYTTDTNQSIIISNVSNIALEGRGSVIHCIKNLQMGFVFMEITNLSITNLQLDQCGAVLPEEVELKIYNITTLSQLRLHSRDFFTKSSPALYLIQVTHITISRVNIKNSTGPGLLGFNIMGRSIVSQSSFTRNNPNCAFLFMDVTSTTTVLEAAALSLQSSEFSFGRLELNQNDTAKSVIFHTAPGLSIITAQTSYNILTNIRNVSVHANNGIDYGNMLFRVHDKNKFNVTFYLHGINCSHSNNSGLAFEKFKYVNSNTYIGLNQKDNNNMIISQSHFVKNSKALSVRSWSWFSYSREVDITIKLENISFHKNSIALDLLCICAVLENVNFTSNSAETEYNNAPIKIEDCNIGMKGKSIFTENRGYIAAIVIRKSSVKFQGNTTFLRNSGGRAGAIYANASRLYFDDNMQFVENEGYDGGAIALHEEPFNRFGFTQQYSLYIAQNLKANFIRNHAIQYGGALYIGKCERYIEVVDAALMFKQEKRLKCFYKPEFELLQSIIIHKTGLMVFTNNTSGIAGSAIYGGWIELCYIQTDVIPFKKYYAGYEFKNVFKIETDNLDLSPVSSQPIRACLCSNSKPDCFKSHHTVKAYPGETFQISIVGVGQMCGTVPSTIHAQFRQTNITNLPEIDTLQSVQKVGRFCKYLSYTVKSSNAVEELALNVVESTINKDVLDVFSSLDYFEDAIIHIELQPCPLGFLLHKLVCICHPQLQALAIECNITSGKIHRETPLWINATLNKEVVGFLVHRNCPFDYCKPYSLDFSLESPNEQCTEHRAGTLCGACQNNLSHILGSSNCRQCSSLWSILIILTFALAGIALVAFLMLLNLTVSVGTINGFIFYANIVRLSQAVFFPNNNNTFLSRFIAWVNLDFGIEVCFYNGMDAYAKTWLQFVFPIYIWFLVIAIIVSSHYYAMAAKLSGRNSVQVLATLFLLSYTKLLRLIITILLSTTLEYPDGSIRRVWLYDGNVDYLKGKHIPLFMAAVLVLLVLSLPYTAVLLFIQCLQQKSKYRILFWIWKFKPLFDAYTGPYKDKHRYWTGLLLLVRGIVLLAFTVNVFGNPATNLLTITITTSCVLFYLAIMGRIYKNKFLSVLECSFSLNIIILSTATLYSRLNYNNQVALTNAFVGIAFITFCAILLYHTQSVVSIKCFHKQSQLSEWITAQAEKVMVKFKNRKHNQEGIQPDDIVHSATQQQVPITFIQLREPLLEYCEPN